jgi:hypothetical protein
MPCKSPKFRSGKSLTLYFIRDFALCRGPAVINNSAARNGGRVTQISKQAWYSALERVGVEGFRWHKLRHIWMNRQQPKFRFSKPLMTLARLSG